MRNIKESLEQIIENLLLIKKNVTDFSQIDKDILLQNLREAYLLVLQSPVNNEMQKSDNQIEEEILPQAVPLVEKVEEKQLEDAQDPEIPLENPEIEEEIPDSITQDTPVAMEEEPVQKEMDEEEMDTDILEFIKEEPQETSEVKVVKEPELFAEPEAEKVVEAEIPKTPEPEIAAAPEPEPVFIPEPQVESIPAPEPVVEAVPEPEAEKVVETVVPEISAFSEPVPEPEQKVAETGTSEPQEPEIATMLEKEPESKEETVRKFVQILEQDPQAQPESLKPQQRSLNDLFNEQKQDLGDKFQQTKITDLTKAMSINDKFLFIRELFKNKSEEFSRAIQTLNKCENIEEAFDIMEGLKKQYFWDSTSSAYLALCDLVRRKF